MKIRKVKRLNAELLNGGKIVIITPEVKEGQQERQTNGREDRGK